MTAFGSRYSLAAISLLISAGCSSSQADSRPPTPTTPVAKVAAKAPSTPTPKAVPPPAPEASLGVRDTGIWADLDGQVQIALPADLEASRVTATIDADAAVLVLAIDGYPRKIYPLTGSDQLTVGSHVLSLRAGDRAELAPLLAAERITTTAGASDRDHDGIPDELDVLVGAKKVTLNGAAYTEGYKEISYPEGDVPRDQGVCTDVVIRAVRNAGIDLQSALQKDIKAKRSAYPMVKGNGNPEIDHRRVKTLLPYFKRQWVEHTAELDDANDPYRPGDIIFMDTFPSRKGPDHIGIVSDTLGESGRLLVVNNWTVGYVESEMDLLGSIPVLHRFRIPPRSN
jgi:uncharacterized protein YijF (DUF1287 family)